MRKLFTDSESRPAKPQIALWAVVTSVLMLGSAIAVWANSGCPTGTLSAKTSGGGNCVCAYPNLVQDPMTHLWSCLASLSCANGTPPGLTDTATNGTCPLTGTNMKQCHVGSYPWTAYSYSAAGCSLVPSDGTIVGGPCVKSTTGTTAYANDGLNYGGCPGYVGPTGPGT
jgi:hypothetical protein